MPKVAFFRDADAPMVEAQGQGASRVRHPGSPDELQLLEVRVNPNERVEVHAHKEAEVMYVLSGEMSFGSQQLRAGDSVSITGLTLYQFTAGPNGASSFRPREDKHVHRRAVGQYSKLDSAGKAEMERRLTEAFLEQLNWKDATGQKVGVD